MILPKKLIFWFHGGCTTFFKCSHPSSPLVVRSLLLCVPFLFRCSSNGCPWNKCPTRRRIKVHGYWNQSPYICRLRYLLFPGHLFQGTLFPVTPGLTIVVCMSWGGLPHTFLRLSDPLGLHIFVYAAFGTGSLMLPLLFIVSCSLQGQVCPPPTSSGPAHPSWLYWSCFTPSCWNLSLLACHNLVMGQVVSGWHNLCLRLGFVQHGRDSTNPA
jgi:hypothetical protein